MGTHWFGKNIVGHGTASSATMRIYLDDDLVIVMCRNAAGANFNVYHPKFIQQEAGGPYATVRNSVRPSPP